MTAEAAEGDRTLPLSHGGPIPTLGFGVFRIPDGEEVRQAVRWAIEAGYRHIDTASAYGNEEGVGRAIRESGVPREEIFITTKLWNQDHGFDAALRAFDRSLERLGLEWVDLYLIHWPVEDLRGESWKALERIHEEGGARAIGVSNYMLPHLEGLLGDCRIPPAVNQIELHPFNFGTRRPLLDFCSASGIVIEAYSPLTKGQRLDDPVVSEVARSVGRTPAQVLIRFALEQGAVVLPKSSNRDRIVQNAQVFDFRLNDDHLRRLETLDEGLATAWDPTDVP